MSISPRQTELWERLAGMERALVDQKRFQAVLIHSSGQKEAVLDSLDERITYHDTRFRILWANREACRSVNLRRDQVIGRHCYDLWEGCATPCDCCPLLSREGVETGMWVREKTEPDGRTWEMRSFPTLNPDGRMIGIVEVGRDVTEMKRLESQLMRAQKMEAMGTLTGGIAHDFNNLLQAVHGYTELLLFRKPSEDPDCHAIRQIQKAAHSASELTEQLLNYSRKVKSDFRPLDFNREIRKIVRILRRTIPKMVGIELDSEKSLNAVNADPAQIEQLLLNLALNARDAMPDGGTLRIETRNTHVCGKRSDEESTPPAGDYVLIRVSDTGQGITPELQELIFEPFFTTKEEGKGTGLGLAMAREVVKNHGGHIRCWSSPGEGTAFEVYLPSVQVTAGVEDAVAPEMPMGGDETILLVDDDSNIRELEEEALARFGYRVIPAENGEQAFEIYRKSVQEIDLVILDLIMPGMGGKKCLEAILDIQPSAKVVIASGYSSCGADAESLKGLAKGFIRKPHNVAYMLKTVRSVLDDTE